MCSLCVWGIGIMMIFCYEISWYDCPSLTFYSVYKLSLSWFSNLYSISLFLPLILFLFLFYFIYLSLFFTIPSLSSSLNLHLSLPSFISALLHLDHCLSIHLPMPDYVHFSVNLCHSLCVRLSDYFHFTVHICQVSGQDIAGLMKVWTTRMGYPYLTVRTLIIRTYPTNGIFLYFFQLYNSFQI